MEFFGKRGGALGAALGLILTLAPVAAQDLQFADPMTTAWAGRVRDRLATRESYESIYQRTNERMRQDYNELIAIQSARPAMGESQAQFQARIYARQQQLRAQLAQTQQMLQRTQASLDPIYVALRKDYDYARAHPDGNVRQSVGSLIAAAANGLDPIWIKIPPVVTPAATAGAAGAVAASGAAEVAAAEAAAAEAAAARATNTAASRTGTNAGAVVDPMRDQTVANAVMQNGSARNAPVSATPEAAAVASATRANVPANAIWTMEANAATGTMMMHARDAATMQRIPGVEPMPTRINTGADSVNAAGNQTLGNLRRAAWQAEVNAAGETSFRQVDWRNHQPIANRPTITAGEAAATETAAANASRTANAGGNTARGGTANAAASEVAATTEAAAAAALSPQRLTNAVWTAEANPSTGMMVLRARDAVTNQHLRGVAAVETQMAIPPSGRSVDGSLVRNSFKDVQFRATHDAATNQLTFTPQSRSGGAVPEGVGTVTSNVPGGTRAGGTAASGTRGPAAASETAAAEGAAAGGEKRGFQMPDAKAVAASAVKWGGLSIGVTLASNVATQFVQNGGRVDWKQATDFLTDSKFWGGTAGGFVGSMAGGALAAFVPGGAFVKAALSIGGAALGYQVGSGSLRQTDWVGLGVTTLGAAAGTTLGAMLGPWGAVAGGIAGHMVSQWLYDKIKEARQGGPIAGPVPPIKGGGYPQQQQLPPVAYVPPPRQQLPPVTQVGQVPSQFPGQQMPVPGQFPGQMPMPGQFPGQAPIGVGQVPVVGQYQPGGTGSGLPSIPNQALLAGPPGVNQAALDGGLAEVTARLNRVYQEKLMADQMGNQGLSYQKMMEYQALRQKLEGIRRGAFQNGPASYQTSY